METTASTPRTLEPESVWASFGYRHPAVCLMEIRSPALPRLRSQTCNDTQASNRVLRRAQSPGLRTNQRRGLCALTRTVLLSLCLCAIDEYFTRPMPYTCSTRSFAWRHSHRSRHSFHSARAPCPVPGPTNSKLTEYQGFYVKLGGFSMTRAVESNFQKSH